MKIKNLLALAVLALNFVKIDAFIVNLETLEYILPEKQNQFVIKAGDAHFGCCASAKHPSLAHTKIAEINKKHAENLVNFAQNYPKNDCLFILEDMFDYHGSNQTVHNHFHETRIKNEESSFTNCMSYINDICKQKNLAVNNIEFRHSAILFVNRGTIKASEFLTDFNAIIDEVRNYNDNAIANEYYKDLVNTILNDNNTVLEIISKDTSLKIDEIEAQFNKKDLKKFRTNINNLVSNYFLLIDARIIHTILSSKDKKYIFICAGNNHLERINEVLKQINYNQKFVSTNNDLIHPIELDSTLNKFTLPAPTSEFPYISIFIILILALSISFPTRFRILHFHPLRMRNLVILFLLIASFTEIKAYIFNSEILEKQSNSESQYIISLGDVHYGCGLYDHPTISNKELSQIHKKQALETINIIEKLNKENCLFILENASQYAGSNTKIQNRANKFLENMEKKGFSSSIIDLHNVCKKKNIDVTNVEFRNFEGAFFRLNIITAEEFLNELEKIIKEIQEYKDLPILNDYYKNLTNNIINNNQTLFNILRTNKDKYYDQIKTKITENQIDTFTADLSELLDARIIHTISINKNKKYIFICAGNNHLERANKILKTLNYNQKFITSNEDEDSPISIQDTLQQLVIAHSTVDFPYISIFIIILFILSISFPRSFRILHLHRLKMGKMS